jgi:hypothetical protein
MNSHYAVEELLRFARGELRGELLGSVEAHLDSCAECSDFLELLQTPAPKVEAGQRVTPEARDALVRRALNLPVAVPPNPLVIKLLDAMDPRWEEFLDTVVAFFAPIANRAASARLPQVSIGYMDAAVMARSFADSESRLPDPRIALLARGLAQCRDKHAKHAAAAVAYAWGGADLSREARSWLSEEEATAVRLRLCFALRDGPENLVSRYLDLLGELRRGRSEGLRTRVQGGRRAFKDVMGKTPAAFATRAITDAAAAVID